MSGPFNLCPNWLCILRMAALAGRGNYNHFAFLLASEIGSVFGAVEGCLVEIEGCLDDASSGGSVGGGGGIGKRFASNAY